MASLALEKLRDQVLELPEKDRAELAHDLLASLDGPPDHDAHAAWAIEIEHRVTEIDSGTVQAVDADEVMHRIATRLRVTR